ncbi:uncharacterized protein LOC124967461 [Sciurus carolinensis]|uniref:uncharacterized protein LOC124967461 n=1 Tax=Sciurus carolinensis TaxID=30640 RepID=UPI001FB1F83B|nr:uncharacterized protein LOC124967461 [Sciurus carolinensis]
MDISKACWLELCTALVCVLGSQREARRSLPLRKPLKRRADLDPLLTPTSPAKSQGLRRRENLCPRSRPDPPLCGRLTSAIQEGIPLCPFPTGGKSRMQDTWTRPDCSFLKCLLTHFYDEGTGHCGHVLVSCGCCDKSHKCQHCHSKQHKSRGEGIGCRRLRFLRGSGGSAPPLLASQAAGTPRLAAPASVGRCDLSLLPLLLSSLSSHSDAPPPLFPL